MGEEDVVQTGDPDGAPETDAGLRLGFCNLHPGLGGL